MDAQRKNWDDLRLFLAVARAGSLSGAARELGVNHSTVFRRIGAFEESLGVRLFDRRPNGYVLTASDVLRGCASAIVLRWMAPWRSPDWRHQPDVKL